MPPSPRPTDPPRPGSTRERVLDAVARHPGASIQRVAADVGVDHSTAAYHLHQLERDDRVAAQPVGRWRAHYVNGSGHCPYLRRVLPRLEARGARPTLAHLLERGEATAADLRGRGLGAGEVRWALEALDGVGLTEHVAWGRVRLAPERGKCALHALERAPCSEWGSCPVSRGEAS